MFLTVALLAGVVLTCPGVAAPTVKKIGLTLNSNNDIPSSTTNTKASPIKLSNTGTVSLSVPGSGAKLDSTINNDTTIVGATQKTTDYVDSARLPGLHGNFIKGISTKLSSNYASPANNTGSSDLTQRVHYLEEELATKQGMLESGNGISIDGKTISLSAEMVALPERLEEINQEIGNLNEKIGTPGVSENYYTIDQTQEYVQQAVNDATKNETVYDSVTKEHKYITIVDDFDAEDFIDKQKETEQ